MQRLAYVCAHCRRSPAARILTTSRTASRSVHTADINDAILKEPRPLSFDRNLGPRKPGPKKRKSVPQRYLDSDDPKRKGLSFYNENTDGNARNDVEQLSHRLTRDPSLVRDVYRSFEALLRKHDVPSSVAIRVMLLKHHFPRELIRALIDHHRKLEGLPSLAEALRMLVSNGINDDKLWAEVMFEYIRTGFYDDAVDLWTYRLECQKDSPLTFGSGPPKERTNKSPPIDKTPLGDWPNVSQAPPVPAHCYPAVAALTAFIYSRRMMMTPTKFTDLMQFLAPNGEDVSALLPSNPEVGGILTEHSIDPKIIELILATLQEFRPYSSQNLARYASIFDRLFIAAANKDLQEVTNIYEEAKLKIPEPKKRNYYINFITAFMQCGSRENGDLLWREMLNSGAIPTAKVWASWLDGCAKAKDIKLFQQSWDRMLAEGIVPDTVCWTIRMQMLFLLKESESAKLCLQYMVENQVPITTVTINVAVEGLIGAGLHKDAFGLIQWATNNGIELDTATYNLVLDSRSKLGEIEGVLETLASMHKNHVLPDIITYGVILRGLYNHSPTPPDLSFLQTILDEMQTAGINPNIQFYNTVIHAMLHRFGDLKGAQYVLSLMPNEAWRTSSVTSAIFINHYGRKKNMEAIEEVWKTMRRNNVAPDEVVYSATVMAYATVGMKTPMLEYLDEMERMRKRISLPTYIWVLKSLMTMQDYQTAGDILTGMKVKGIDILANKELRWVVRKLKEVVVTAQRDAYGKGTFRH
ncbi:hypothetical protein TWF481_011822 [Arthrobotrys musiformis]|uniref:Pentacotripeptide-repeat region of PRORP domain-containing protein n=1 Tax=Arthrobotrys musiformis TaxID=47236 RepID=A0AAV9VV86_9PEZI